MFFAFDTATRAGLVTAGVVVVVVVTAGAGVVSDVDVTESPEVDAGSDVAAASLSATTSGLDSCPADVTVTVVPSSAAATPNAKHPASKSRVDTFLIFFLDWTNQLLYCIFLNLIIN